MSIIATLFGRGDDISHKKKPLRIKLKNFLIVKVLGM